MRQGKEISSVKNSIQTRLSGVMLLVLVFALGINVFIFKQIHTAVTRIDAVFSSNTAVNELSESLEQVESTVYEYLNTKSTQALENYYRYEQNYKNLIEELNDRNLDNEVKMLEKNIRRMSESYLEQTNETVQAKRGRNVEKYKTSYEDENELYEYINVYIYKLNNLRFKTNSANYQLLLLAMNVLYKLCIFVMLVVYALGLAVTTLLVRNMIRPLTALSNTAHEVAKGNLNVPQLPVVVEDEVGVVTRSFNQMLESIRQNIEQLKESMEDAHRANLSKTAFLRRMSHDIRTPMNAIMGMATIAKAHVDERERILDCMEKINGASKLLLSLINEVLDMSKIESGRLILSEDEFNVGELLQDLVVMMQPEIKNKQQTLNIHVKNLRHENVKGDTQRIKQVLMNILSNAIKYTPENGRITIEIYEKDPHNGIGNYQFVFEDNGRGMKPEFLDKIFEPFERASDDEIKRIQGTGLGMSISHKIIQMMGGDIKVESEYGKGSRFTIDMPLVCRDQKPDDKIEVEGLEVLVVDDDKIACLNTSSCLREIGINSECVYSGSEAIEKVRQHHLAEKEYFAVIIDLKMPQMNGIETTRQIRRFVGADVPIIILSAYDLEEYEAEAKEVKANGFITKPLYKSKLLQVLRSFLDEGDQPEPIRPFKLSNVDYSGKRILLVEDNELNREIAVEIIGSTGITIDTAINGLDAVHKVAQSEEGFYQIILMDIQMPIMDGYEATRQIRSLQRRDIAHMPIIAMTANAFSEDVTNAIKAGMNYHLAKPIDIGALMGILSKYLQAPA